MKYYKFKPQKETISHLIKNVQSNCEWLTLVNKNYWMNKKAVFEGTLPERYTPKEYKVRIICQEKKIPQVYILNLDFSNNRPEHLYGDNSLCLTYPKNYEYQLSDLVFPKIIDWLLLWIYFYEIWTLTGEWHGGGISHSSSKGGK